jgi:hypothetical protein
VSLLVKLKLKDGQGHCEVLVSQINPVVVAPKAYRIKIDYFLLANKKIYFGRSKIVPA